MSDDRVAEVWAPNGVNRVAGSGVVVGRTVVLTVAWQSADWDLALLVVRQDGTEAEARLEPDSPTPAAVRLGTAPETSNCQFLWIGRFVHATRGCGRSMS
nr:hypothetical protein OG999_22700 [Streptomyces sp. NBC_00886]